MNVLGSSNDVLVPLACVHVGQRAYKLPDDDNLSPNACPVAEFVRTRNSDDFRYSSWARYSHEFHYKHCRPDLP